MDDFNHFVESVSASNKTDSERLKWPIEATQSPASYYQQIVKDCGDNIPNAQYVHPSNNYPSSQSPLPNLLPSRESPAIVTQHHYPSENHDHLSRTATPTLGQPANVDPHMDLPEDRVFNDRDDYFPPSNPYHPLGVRNLLSSRFIQLKDDDCVSRNMFTPTTVDMINPALMMSAGLTTSVVKSAADDGYYTYPLPLTTHLPDLHLPISSSTMSPIESNAAITMASMSTSSMTQSLRQTLVDNDEKQRGYNYYAPHYSEEPQDGSIDLTMGSLLDSRNHSPPSVRTLAERKQYPITPEETGPYLPRPVEIPPVSSLPENAPIPPELDQAPQPTVNNEWFRFFPWLEEDNLLLFCRYCKEVDNAGMFSKGQSRESIRKDEFIKHELGVEHRTAEAEYYKVDISESQLQKFCEQQARLSLPQDKAKYLDRGNKIHYRNRFLLKDIISEEDSTFNLSVADQQLHAHWFSVFPWLLLNLQDGCFSCLLCNIVRDEIDKDSTGHVWKIEVHKNKEEFAVHENSSPHHKAVDDLHKYVKQAKSMSEVEDRTLEILLQIREILSMVPSTPPSKNSSERKRRKNKQPQKLKPPQTSDLINEKKGSHQRPEDSPPKTRSHRAKSFRNIWLNEFSWLELDTSKNLLFCKLCREFSTGGKFSEGLAPCNRKDGFKDHEQSESHCLAKWKSTQQSNTSSCEPESQKPHESSKDKTSIVSPNKDNDGADSLPRDLRITQDKEIVSVHNWENQHLPDHIDNEWFARFPWLVYRPQLDQLQCVMCLKLQPTGEETIVDEQYLISHEDQTCHKLGYESYETSIASKLDGSSKPYMVDRTSTVTSQWPTAFLQSAKRLKEDGVLCDVTLSCKDESGQIKDFKAHKLILSCASSWFLNKLKDNPSESKIHIDNITACCLRGLLDFLYGHPVDETDTNSLRNLRDSARKLDIECAKDLFQSRLKELGHCDSDEESDGGFQDGGGYEIPVVEEIDSDETLVDQENVSQTRLPVVRKRTKPTLSFKKTTKPSFHKCNQCGVKFLKLAWLTRHKVKQHGKERPVVKREFKCNDCDKTFVSKFKLEEHKRSHTKVRPFVCSTCNKTFAKRSIYVEHLRRHEPESERKFQCKFCQKTFVKAGDMERHIIGIHSGEKPFQCQHCGKAFPWRRSLADHLKKHEKKIPRPHACDQCPLTFMRKYDLTRHKVRHSKDKPFICEWCAAKFTQKGSMDKHKREACRMRPGVEQPLPKSKKKQRTKKGELPAEIAVPSSDKPYNIPFSTLDNTNLHNEVMSPSRMLESPLLPLDYTHVPKDRAPQPLNYKSQAAMSDSNFQYPMSEYNPEVDQQFSEASSQPTLPSNDLLMYSSLTAPNTWAPTPHVANS